MKTLNDLQVGDWVAFDRLHNGRDSTYLARVTARNGGEITVGRNHFSDKHPSAGSLGIARIPTANEIAAKEAEEAAKVAQRKQREAFEAREGYQLAKRIASVTESGVYDRLSHMPVERLRQIAAWLEELP